MITELQEMLSSQWREIKTLKLYAEVVLQREDGVHEGYMELSFRAPLHLRADFTHDKDALVGMVFHKPEKGVNSSWEYYPGQRIIKKVGQPPKPPPQPVHTPYIRKLISSMRWDAHHLAALLTGHLLDTTRLNYTSIQKAGNTYILTGAKDPGLVGEVTLRGGVPVINRVQYPKQILNPNPVVERGSRIVMEYDRFTKISEIPFPMSVKASSLDTGWFLEIFYTRIEVNPELDNTVFKKPKWQLPKKR